MDTITLDPDEEVTEKVSFLLHQSFFLEREFRPMMLLLAHSLPFIYSGCGSGPLSHWED